MPLIGILIGQYWRLNIIKWESFQKMRLRIRSTWICWGPKNKRCCKREVGWNNIREQNWNHLILLNINQSRMISMRLECRQKYKSLLFMQISRTNSLIHWLYLLQLVCQVKEVSILVDLAIFTNQCLIILNRIFFKPMMCNVQIVYKKLILYLLVALPSQNLQI